MDSVGEKLCLFVQRFGLLAAACCDQCCGEQVSLVQSQILSEIRRWGAPSMQRVAEELRMDLTTFSRQAKSLETKGLISRRLSADDRRVTLLSLTPAGEAILARIDNYMTDRITQLFSTMTPFERETVAGALGLLHAALATTCPPGAPAGKNIADCKQQGKETP